MSWEIIAGFITLAGSVITICKIVSANTKALTKLEDSITRLDTTLTAQGKDLEEIDKTVQNHETRITVLEQK